MYQKNFVPADIGFRSSITQLHENGGAAQNASARIFGAMLKIRRDVPALKPEGVTMASFTEGHEYQFTLPDGRIIVLRFQGFARFMEPVWIDPKSGAEVELPPFHSYKLV